MLGRTELHTWHWLRQVFPEHHVMVKLPVTRFCKPRDRSAAEGLFAMLSGVYCTFTLADETGRAIGCVDVMDPHRLSRGNRQLKQNLLAQCHVGYWLLTPDALPEPWAIRAEFLGLGATESNAGESVELQTARDNLVETLDRRRNDRRSSQMAPLEGGGDGPASPTGASRTRSRSRWTIATATARHDAEPGSLIRPAG
jgi:hypothetical protein